MRNKIKQKLNRYIAVHVGCIYVNTFQYNQEIFLDGI